MTSVYVVEIVGRLHLFMLSKLWAVDICLIFRSCGPLTYVYVFEIVGRRHLFILANLSNIGILQTHSGSILLLVHVIVEESLFSKNVGF